MSGLKRADAMTNLPPHPAPSAGFATVAIPGTCGELVQGLVGDVPCLVSCPIDRYARATVNLSPEADEWRTPPGKTKALAALRRAATRLELAGGGVLHFSSGLPDSKGYGSSTADAASAVYALGVAAGRPFDAPDVARLAIQVEPSDSTMFPGLALLAHRTGEHHETLGQPPALDILLLDTGGTVDTLAFNRDLPWEVMRQQAPRVRDALAMLRDGIRQRDPKWVAQAATLSAKAHQAILPKSNLEAVLEAGRKAGALGVSVAHSGTLIGVLFRPVSRDERAARTTALRDRLGTRVAVAGWTSLVEGGPRLLTRNRFTTAARTLS